MEGLSLFSLIAVAAGVVLAHIALLLAWWVS